MVARPDDRLIKRGKEIELAIEPMRRGVVLAAVVTNIVLVGVALTFALTPRAGAHLDYSLITGDQYWTCSDPSGAPGCRYWVQGPPGQIVHHSFAFTSAKHLSGPTDGFTCAGIERVGVYYDNACSGGGANQFVRNCWSWAGSNWQHSGNPLDCHDRDGVTHRAEIRSWNSGTASLEGHSLW